MKYLGKFGRVWYGWPYKAVQGRTRPYKAVQAVPSKPQPKLTIPYPSETVTKEE